LQTLEELSADDTTRTVVIRDVGDKAFWAGYDIGSLPARRSDGPHEKMKKFQN